MQRKSHSIICAQPALKHQWTSGTTSSKFCPKCFKNGRSNINKTVMNLQQPCRSDGNWFWKINMVWLETWCCWATVTTRWVSPVSSLNASLRGGGGREASAPRDSTSYPSAHHQPQQQSSLDITSDPAFEHNDNFPVLPQAISRPTSQQQQSRNQNNNNQQQQQQEQQYLQAGGGGGTRSRTVSQIPVDDSFASTSGLQPSSPAGPPQQQ